MPTTISIIISALVTLIEGWKAPTGILADLADAMLALNAVKTVAPNAPFLQAAYQAVNQTEAGVANLASGQAAVVASDTIGEVGYTLVLVKNGSTAGQALGL